MIKNMNKVFCMLMIIIFATPAYSDSVKRPGPNNKIGHTKKTEEERKNSLMNKILEGRVLDEKSDNKTNDEIKNIKKDIELLKSNNSDSDDGNEKIIKQIRMLSDLKNDGIITEDEFKAKKSFLLEKIQ